MKFHFRDLTVVNQNENTPSVEPATATSGHERPTPRTRRSHAFWRDLEPRSTWQVLGTSSNCACHRTSDLCVSHTADLVPSRFVRVNAQGKTRSSELAYQQAQKGNERRAWLFMYEGTNRTKWFRSFTPPHNLLNLRCTKQCYPGGFQVHLIHIAMQVMISRGSSCSAE